MKIKNTIIATIITVGIISGATYTVLNYRAKESEPAKQEQNKKPADKPDNTQTDKDKKDDEIKKEEDKVVQNEKPAPSTSTTRPVSGTTSKPSVPVVSEEKPGELEQPTSPDVPVVPEKPEEPIKPEQPDEPVQPEELTDIHITADMVNDGLVELADKKYRNITIDKDLPVNTHVALKNVEVEEALVLEMPDGYRLDVIDSKIPLLHVSGEQTTYRARIKKAQSLTQVNKTLKGATINFDDASTVDEIALASDVEINGTRPVENVVIASGKEIILNIPCTNVASSMTGTLNLNKPIANFTNTGQGASITINSDIDIMNNDSASTFRLSGNAVVANFSNRAENTTVSGNGTITNASISASNTIVYTTVTNPPQIAPEVDNVLFRKESKVDLVDVHSTSQSSVTFTLSEPVSLTLKDVSIICTRGKDISLFDLVTTDNTTYTLTTSYYKNDSYGLYITLPNGNIISRDFDTDYANPTVGNVVATRETANTASIELYGVDEGGIFHYILKDPLNTVTPTSDEITASGLKAPVKVGYNEVSLTGLIAETEYELYYYIEGYFQNSSQVKGPVPIASTVKDQAPNEYNIVYAKEETINRFVFKLDKVPKKKLTLQDFEIICPSQSALTTSGATFIVSPDMLTYILIVPDNYGHGDNKYTVKIAVTDEKKIEASFVSHFNPPTITGAVGNVERPDENTAVLKFNSDEAGTIYYGVYEWNGGIYDFNSTTPFAQDVLTGAVAGKTQALSSGENILNIDLTGMQITSNTRIWALFVDYAGNYRTGFVDHYKISQYVKPEEPSPDQSTLAIAKFTATSNSHFAIDFNETIDWVSSSDIRFRVISGGALQTLTLSIDNDTPKHLGISILNYQLPAGVYEMIIAVKDSQGRAVTLTQQFTIK